MMVYTNKFKQYLHQKEKKVSTNCRTDGVLKGDLDRVVWR